MRSLACLIFVVATFYGAVAGPANAASGCSGGSVTERAQASIGLTSGINNVLMAVLSKGATAASKTAAQTFGIINGILFDVVTLTLEPNFVPEFKAGISTLKEAQDARKANEGKAIGISGVVALRNGMTMQDLKDLGLISN